MKYSSSHIHLKYKSYIQSGLNLLNHLLTKKEAPRPMKEFKVEDLLKRPAVEVDLRDVESQLSGRVVLVTGGGGSIGSELCRQIIKMKPSKLLILDHSELNLYHIDSELAEMKSEVEVEVLLADIKDLAAMANIFETYRPEFIYHAAAYKHVHLVEKNP
ncbi:MAG: SDR family NAD(P)-dependent oxidoreductase, partial [Bacteriovoracia bacterium]